VYCLDYDGTLREIVEDPDAAYPTPALEQLFSRLEEAPDLDVYIVSGRKPADLERWLGRYRFTLVAEHGIYHRPVGTGEWLETVPGVDFSWKEEILPIFKHYEDSTPGSHVEEKQSSVVWHYRRSDPEFGRWKANQLMGELYGVISNLPVAIHHGKAIVEASSLQVSKGIALEMLLGQSKPGLVLCAGDDQTDESMFTTSIENVVSIKVGPGDTGAKYRVRNPREFRELLGRILQVGAPAATPTPAGHQA
jgi:trehalose 6-phosphate synthase/phosphatase